MRSIRVDIRACPVYCYGALTNTRRQKTMKKTPPAAAPQMADPKTWRKKRLPRSQSLRVARIAALLKTNRCPSAEELCEEYRKLEIEEGKKVKGSYTRRTVCRDMAVLREDYGCPVKFDWGEKKYVLTDPKWEFNSPADLSESVMLALILGGRIAEEIFPDPLRARIRSSVDELLKGNSPEFLEKTLIDSLKVFEQGGVAENPAVFIPVFEAWQTQRRIHIRYCDQHGNETERDVDPQVLFLYQHEWRIKGFCSLRKKDRTFVINRIKNVWPLDVTFKPSKRTVDSVTLDDIVEYPKVNGVKIKLTGDAVQLAMSTSMHSRQKVKVTRDGGMLLIPKIAPEVIIPWILSQGGDAVPLEPPELVERTHAAVRAMSERMNVKQ